MSHVSVKEVAPGSYGFMVPGALVPLAEMPAPTVAAGGVAAGAAVFTIGFGIGVGLGIAGIYVYRLLRQEPFAYHPTTAWSRCEAALSCLSNYPFRVVYQTGACVAITSCTSQQISGSLMPVNWKHLSATRIHLYSPIGAAMRRHSTWTKTSVGDHPVSYAYPELVPGFGRPLVLPDELLDPAPATAPELDPNIRRALPPGFGTQPDPRTRTRDDPARHDEDVIRFRWPNLPTNVRGVSPSPRPGHGTTPGTGTSPGTSPAPSSPPGGPPGRSIAPVRNPQPPRRGTKEKKAKSIGTRVAQFLDMVSEASEVADCAFKALPQKTQDRWSKGREERPGDQMGQYGIDGADWKLQAVWHNWEKVDAAKFAACVVANEIEDRLYGAAHGARDRLRPRKFGRTISRGKR